MAFSGAELTNIANAALNFHLDKGKVHAQHIQDKPLFNALKAKQKTFPGGKGAIELRPIFETQSTTEGFEHDDTLSFVNPAPIKVASYDWKMIHCGINVTMDELLRDGISVVDTNGESTRNHSDREMTAIANLLEVKLADMSEGYAAGMNSMLWKDGTQDPKEVPGVQYLVSADPTVGVVGGIDRATQPLWRNVTLAGANKVTSNTGTSALILAMQKKVRTLKRYGTPKHLILCGSAFMDALEAEAYAKGTLTQTGFGGKTDVGIGQISLNGLGTFMYDPTLDTLSRSKFAYFIDTNAIGLQVIDGEDMKRHNPARPHDKMVIYKSVTWAGALVARQLNTSMVVEIA